MDKQHVLVVLREHAPELKAAGVVSLRLFGSVARGDANAHSDVDLLADFQADMPITLVTLGSLQYRLSAWLGTHVDLSSTNSLRGPIREQAMREAVLAF
jgi:predicted nucleotidyltransferase